MSKLGFAGPFVFTDSAHSEEASDPENSPNTHHEEVPDAHEVDSLSGYEKVSSSIDHGNSNLDLLPFAVDDKVEDNKSDETCSDYWNTWVTFILSIVAWLKHPLWWRSRTSLEDTSKIAILSDWVNDSIESFFC